jgi:PAS domain S-box-containing protein
MAAGISFSLYANVYDLRNFFGHYFKVISAYVIYKAIIETGLRRPYDVLFRNLKQKEIALSESEAKYRSMVEANQDPVYICSPDYKISYMNQAMIERTGYDAIGKPCHKALGGYEAKCQFCFFDEVKEKKSVIKETFRQKDGRYYHVTHSPIFHVDGSISKLAVFRDVSDLKKIETEYRMERDRAMLYLDIVGNIVVVLNPDTSVALINKRGCELLEAPEKDILGKKWFDTFVPEKDRAPARAVFQGLMSGVIQPLRHFENRIVSRNNHEKIILWYNNILKAEDGAITGTLSSGDDITATRKAQDELLWELGVNSALSELYAPLTSPEISLRDISLKILEKAKMITGSEHGFVSTIDPVTGANTSHSLTEMMGECNLDEKNKTIVFPRGEDGAYHGLWGYPLNTLEPFFTNAPASHPSFIGLPRGHIAIKNFLSIPVLLHGNLIGQIGLCNKKDDYREMDLEAINRLSMYYALAIHRWETAAKLSRAKDELEMRVEERTLELSRSNVLLTEEVEERKVLEESLLTSEKTLKDLSAKLIQSYEEERRRIGEELHDGLAQTLSAIKVWSDAAMAQMERNKFDQSLESIGSILALAKASVEEVRRIIKNLRPAILDDLGLHAAISWLCQEFEKMRPAIVLGKEIQMVDQQVPENLKIVIFRIIQESLNNISKHSNATSVSILLDQTPETIALKISDNGVGFDLGGAKGLQPLEKGIGLTSMEERARLSGGEFTILSSPGRGTIVQVIWTV